MREYRLKDLVIIVLSALLMNGCAHAQPTKGNKREIVTRIQQLQATPTTPENVHDRSRQIKQLLNMLEQKRGRTAVEQVASRETQQEFVRAINSNNYAAACRIADDIINNLAQLAKSMTGEGRRIPAADEHIVKFPAKDGKDATGYLQKPQGEAKFPAIILLHGGVSSRGATKALGSGKHAQRLNKEGYVTLAVHYRESGLGLDELNDVIGAIDYLKTLPYVDGDRIALFGSSHGGYLSLLAACRVDDAISAVVDNFGFTNMIAQYNNVIKNKLTHCSVCPRRHCHTDDDIARLTAMANKYYGGGPKQSNLQLYKSISPYYNVEKIAAPVLVIHGKNDCSVPIQNQGYDFIDALKRAGKRYEKRIFEDGQHGFIYDDTDEAKDALEVTLDFLERHVKAKPADKVEGEVLSYENFDSPFGFHSAYYGTSPFKNAKEIGVTWDRGAGIGGYLTPVPQFEKGNRPNKEEVIKEARTRIKNKVYSFDSFDKHMRQVPRGVNIVQNIGPTKKEVVPWVKFFNKPGSWLPKDEYMDYYLTFVERAVERYDGDGKNDMPGLKSPIKYWQIGNEPHYKRNMKDLARLVKETQRAIKKADPEAKIILGGASLQPLVDDYLEQLRNYYYPILDALGGKDIDVFDFHWYGKADGDYKKIRAVYKDIRKNLDLRGYKDTEIWVTEMGTYSGAPGGKKYNWPVQTEREQATDLLKRYVYSLSLGIKKIFWAWGMVEGFPPADDNHFFDHTGLIYDGRKLSSKDVDRGRGVKKLAFYTYKMMTDKLEGVDWDRIETLEERDGIHIYKVAKQGKYIWVAWSDNKDAKEIVISGIKSKGVKIVEAVPKHESGKDVIDVQKAFRIRFKTTDKEKVSLTLDQIPVFVEEE